MAWLDATDWDNCWKFNQRCQIDCLSKLSIIDFMCKLV